MGRLGYEWNVVRHRVLKLFVFIETTNGNMGMVKVWFGYALIEPGNIFFSHVVIKPQLFVMS